MSDRGPPPPVGSSKTLSKSLLYLPLVAYDSTTNTANSSHKLDNRSGGGDGGAQQQSSSSSSRSDPHAYMASRKSLPKNVVEISLIDFWHKVGVEYHRHQATARDSKNNGSRPLSASEMDDRIRQRALMLVGGGINKATSITTANSTSSANKKKDTHREISRKRKQQQKRAMKFESSHNTATDVDDDGDGVDMNDKVDAFLHQLNGLWNDYIVELLQLEQYTSSLAHYYALTRNVEFWSSVTSKISHETAQLVGAQVRIKACPQQKHLEGQKGFLMGITKNTWTVMMMRLTKLRLPRPDKKQKLESKNHNEENKNTTNDAGTAKTTVWKSVVVPKRSSILSLLIPIKIGDETSSMTSDKSNPDGEKKLPLLVIDLKEDA